MTAKQDLIAAALTLADTHPGDIGGIYHAQKDLQEMCARAMVQSVGEVPMPEADMRGPIGTGVYFNGYTPNALRTYGDAREAAGYARGLAEADKLAHTLAMARSTFKKYADLHSAKGTDDGREKAAANMRLVNLCDAALRGEVK